MKWFIFLSKVGPKRKIAGLRFTLLRKSVTLTNRKKKN